jgi:hypothetical protein
MISQVTIGPSAAWPSDSPELVSAFGSAQRPGGNQLSMKPVVIGKIGEFVAPTTRRTAMSDTIARRGGRHEPGAKP